MKFGQLTEYGDVDDDDDDDDADDDELFLWHG